MLTERTDLDQLFHQNLRDFSANPPAGLWENIESRLDSKIRMKKIIYIASIAASFLLMLCSGWWLNESVYSDKKITTENILALNHSDQSSLKEQKEESGEKISSSNTAPAYSMASFAAKLSFKEKNNNNSIPAGEEPVQFDIDKKLLSHFQSEQNVLSKIGEMFSLNQKMEKIPDPDPNTREDQNLTAQSDGFLKKIHQRWSLGTTASPVFTGGIKSMPGELTKPLNTFAGGVTAGYKISKRAGLKTGLFFNQIAQSMTAATEINNPQSKQVLDYIELPLLADYKIIDRKLNIGITAGISTNILVKNKVTYTGSSNNAQPGQAANIRDVAYAGVIGLEIGYNLGKRISISIEPRIKQYLHSLNTDPNNHLTPYQIGIYSGVTYSFE